MHTTDPRLVALRDSLAGRTLRGSGRTQYILRERIGEGGQGWVFKANWDEPGGFVVIVKVLRPDAVNADTLRRFQREADVLRMLSQQGMPNPHVVRFFDHATANLTGPSGEQVSLPFTVLEYVNGTTLEQVIDAQPGKGLPAERTRRVIRQVTQALETVHQQKVIHRDLKPSNILLSIEAGVEIAKVTDFGLVKVLDVLRTAMVAGASMGYAPPEQFEQGNQRVTAKTDIFSLAAITYEMLAGRMAFPYREGENPLLVVTRIMNGPRPSLAKAPEALSSELRARPDIVAQLDALLGRAMAPDPADRHGSVTEYFAALEPLLRVAAEGKQPSAPPGAGRSMAFSETMPADSSVREASLRPSDVPIIVSGPGMPPSAFGGGQASVPRVAFAPVSMPQPSALSPVAGTGENAAARRPSGDTSNPALWTWRVATQPVKPDVIRGASMHDDGTSIVAIGPAGLARWERSQWFGVSLPAGFDPRRARGVRQAPGGELVIFGENGLALRLAKNGAHAVLGSADADANFFDALVEPDGTVTLVGERPSRSSVTRTTFTDRVGLFAQYQGSRLALVADAAPSGRLRAVTRTTTGMVVSCGDRGSLVRLHNGAAEFIGTICTGDLFALAALPGGGATAVGAGGHALTLSPSFEAKLEAVQTTRDLLCVAVSAEGTCWAGAQAARLVRRTGESWVRMCGDLGVSADVVSLWCGPRSVRAACTDGSVIEGQLP